MSTIESFGFSSVRNDVLNQGGCSWGWLFHLYEYATAV